LSSLWFKKRRSADADRRVAYNISIQHGIQHGTQRTYGRLSCGSRSREAPTADRRCRPPSRRTACASSRRSRCAGVPTGRDCRAYVLLCRGPDARTGLARFDCATHSVQYSIVQQTTSAAGAFTEVCGREWTGRSASRSTSSTRAPSTARSAPSVPHSTPVPADGPTVLPERPPW
jgi:hypothetical protein